MYKGCQCGERQRIKGGGWWILTNTRWRVCVCSWIYNSVIHVKVDTEGCDLDEDVTDLGFELSKKQSGGSRTGPFCFVYQRPTPEPVKNWPVSDESAEKKLHI